ncbi:MAG: hypothetical protein V4577_22210 [Bacteroidota bacterium]
MIILVNHKIGNPAAFWQSAQQSLPQLPDASVQLVLQVIPNTDMNEATCIWEAASIDALDSYLRSKVGDASSETYYEVNVANAMGIPA